MSRRAEQNTTIYLPPKRGAAFIKQLLFAIKRMNQDRENNPRYEPPRSCPGFDITQFRDIPFTAWSSSSNGRSKNRLSFNAWYESGQIGGPHGDVAPSRNQLLPFLTSWGCPVQSASVTRANMIHTGSPVVKFHKARYLS